MLDFVDYQLFNPLQFCVEQLPRLPQVPDVQRAVAEGEAAAGRGGGRSVRLDGRRRAAAAHRLHGGRARLPRGAAAQHPAKRQYCPGGRGEGESAREDEAP